MQRKMREQVVLKQTREGERGGQGQAGAGVHRALSPAQPDVTPTTKLGFRAGITPLLHEGVDAQPCHHLPITQGAAVLTPSSRGSSSVQKVSAAPSFSTASSAVITTY